MKYLHFIPLIMLTASCSSPQGDLPTTPVFEYFTYSGHDARYDTSFNPETQYLNPVISGTNPDPSICRQGNDFFMANSSFVYWPGIPVWHSKDLVDWDFCGYVIDRHTQSVFQEGLRITGGVYAPDIKYCEQNQTFYLIVTLVDGMGNVIFKTQDPYTGGSEPIPVPEVHGIDPSLLFDNNGKCYIVNNDEPAYPAEYSGHRAIWGREYDLNTDKVCGEPMVLIDKCIRPQDKPIWTEGPHLYHFNNKLEGRNYDQYYLMTAEGGTAEGHSEVVLAGKSPLGKFTPCQQNPILTQRTLPHDRANAVACAGHADLVQVGSSSLNNNAMEGEWWSVFLACTTYKGDQLYNTGRSTFLLPVSWQKDAKNNGIQPLILHPDSAIQTVCAKSEWQRNVYRTASGSVNHGVGSKSDSCNLLTGNGSYSDHFKGNGLHPLWFTLRTPMHFVNDGRIASWYEVKENGLEMTPRATALSDKGQPSLLCRWVKNATYSAQAKLLFYPTSPLALSGLTLYQTEEAHYILGKRMNEEGTIEMVLIKTDKNKADVVVAHQVLTKEQAKCAVLLKADVKESEAQFSYSFDDGAAWFNLGQTQDADILTSNYTDSFTGCVVGLFAYRK